MKSSDTTGQGRYRACAFLGRMVHGTTRAREVREQLIGELIVRGPCAASPPCGLHRSRSLEAKQLNPLRHTAQITTLIFEQYSQAFRRGRIVQFQSLVLSEVGTQGVPSSFRRVAANPVTKTDIAHTPWPSSTVGDS